MRNLIFILSAAVLVLMNSCCNAGDGNGGNQSGIADDGTNGVADISKNKVELTDKSLIDKILDEVKEKYSEYRVSTYDGVKVDFDAF